MANAVAKCSGTARNRRLFACPWLVVMLRLARPELAKFAVVSVG